MLYLSYNCWHFNIYEQDKFHAQLSWAWKKFHNLGPRPLALIKSNYFHLTEAASLFFWLPSTYGTRLTAPTLKDPIDGI